MTDKAFRMLGRVMKELPVEGAIYNLSKRDGRRLISEFEQQATQLTGARAELGKADNEIAGLQKSLAQAQAEAAALREVGSFMLGWHPTDPGHPAFDKTREFGEQQMAKLLLDVRPAVARIMAVIEAAKPFAGIETGWKLGDDDIPDECPVACKPNPLMVRGGPTVGDVRRLRAALEEQGDG